MRQFCREYQKFKTNVAYLRQTNVSINFTKPTIENYFFWTAIKESWNTTLRHEIIQQFVVNIPFGRNHFMKKLILSGKQSQKTNMI